MNAVCLANVQSLRETGIHSSSNNTQPYRILLISGQTFVERHCLTDKPSLGSSLAS